MVCQTVLGMLLFHPIPQVLYVMYRVIAYQVRGTKVQFVANERSRNILLYQ
ncbi:MAG: hypothetical protein PUP92_30235 [Rhizonema sp. PD38]|nr:hypothetical protein [Rhizonema sp. PD38]